MEICLLAAVTHLIPLGAAYFECGTAGIAKLIDAWPDDISAIIIDYSRSAQISGHAQIALLAALIGILGLGPIGITGRRCSLRKVRQLLQLQPYSQIGLVTLQLLFVTADEADATAAIQATRCEHTPPRIV